MKKLETERIILRPWREDDAAALYKYASDPAVGPIAGWEAHRSPEYSLNIIRTVLSDKNTYAVTIKGSDEAVGSIGIFTPPIDGAENDMEIGYWIGVPFWGNGYIPEAVREMLRHGFEDMKIPRMWCGYYEGNDKSRRVIEKCGFKFAFRREHEVPQMREIRTEIFYNLTEKEWRG